MTSCVEFIVRGYHLDFFGHVNNARYLEFLEDGRWDYYGDVIESDYFKVNRLGFAVVNININYRRPATLGQRLVVETAVKSVGAKSITLIQKVFFKDTRDPVVDADVKFVIVDFKTGRALPMTGELKQRLTGS
jgi:thioesterase III